MSPRSRRPTGGASTWGSIRCHSALHSPLDHGLGRQSSSFLQHWGPAVLWARRLRIWLPLDAALDPCAAATPGGRRLRSAGLAARNRLMELDCAVATVDCLSGFWITGRGLLRSNPKVRVADCTPRIDLSGSGYLSRSCRPSSRTSLAGALRCR
jgi:hypothetical protein